MEEGSGRGSGRVGSDFLSAIAGWVGSGQRFVGSGRVQEKWPVDNSGLALVCTATITIVMLISLTKNNGF